MDDARAILDRLPLLDLLPDDLRRQVEAGFAPAAFTFGSPIVREGEPADAYYVLTSGTARVLKRAESGEEVSLGTLRPGDSFGEMGLLEGGRRTATVRASGDVEVVKLERSAFEALRRARPEIREYLALQVKTRRLSNFFRHVTPFARLPVDALRELLAEITTVSVPRGERLIREGDPPGPMFVVEEGRLRVFTKAEGQRRYLAYLRAGDFFGELSVLKGAPRTASVEAVSACRLLRLTAETFVRLAGRHPEFKAQVEAWTSQYDYRRVARVPLDFAEELLPADAAVPATVQAGRAEHARPLERRPAAEAGAGPFATPEGAFAKRGRRVRRFAFVRQIDEMDCGTACLAMICRHFGRSVSLGLIRQRVHATLDGTSLKALCQGAEGLGLAARPVKASAHNVAQMPLPAILHWRGNHWVVLYDLDAKQARIADPALGLRRLPRREFDRAWTGYAALFDYTQRFEQTPEGHPGFAWLWPFLRPFAGLFAKASALALIVSALQMVVPVFTQVVVDRVVVDRDVGLLHGLLAAMAAILVFSVLAMGLQRYLLSFAAVRIDAAALDFLTRRLLALPMSYFNARRTGDIQRRLAGIRRVREFLVQNGVVGVSAAAQLGASVLLMFAYSPPLALTFLATVPLYALLMRVSVNQLRPLFAGIEEAFAQYHSYQIDAIKGIETVKAMAGEPAFRGLMLREFHGVAQRLFKADFTLTSYEGAVRAVGFLSTVLFLWVGAHQVMAGALSVGGLVAFSALIALANGPTGTLLSLWDEIQASSVLLDRVNDVLEHEPEQGHDHSRLRSVRSLEGRVELRRLGFRYGGPDSSPILEDVTVEVPPGKTVAIVGRSGSGKTTLVKCLAGLLPPSSGTILFDGVDLAKLNHRDLRRQVGFVLQENHLFSDTIARNIAFGEEEPDLDRVLWAARLASAHEFVDRLPLGYDTRVGESGLALSGGQRQRIAIARAVYHRPPILIFDEATSSLDTESERAVKQGLGELLQGRTAFVIAHRLSTVRDADLILVLEKGRLAERGSHDELMDRQGLYYYLCSQQLEL